MVDMRVHDTLDTGVQPFEVVVAGVRISSMVGKSWTTFLSTMM